ncbi:MAG TPA: cell envelope integrity protein CreD [Caldithrix sp.]|nr:cell envelope integrity protein CreD [Caldithrix sp.]
MLKKGLKNSMGLRLGIIALLTLLLLIPAAMIQSTIEERQERRDSVINEINQKWGTAQTLSGPVLSIPYRYYYKNADDEIRSSINYMHFLPADLQITGKVNPEIRYRGIYEAVLYNSEIEFTGLFKSVDYKKFKVPDKDILWDDAFVAIGISDMKGIQDLISLAWNDEIVEPNPGITTNDVLDAGISAPVPVNPDKLGNTFNFKVNINGSAGLYFTPVGQETRVELSSSWKDPSFIGMFIPDEHEISDNGFSAIWKILHLNRNYPQQWIGGQYKINVSSFGVDLPLPVDEYQKTMRTTKYAIMFISLTFLAFFMIELLNKRVLHPIQYLLIGFALLLFFTLLLALTEHLLFRYAYIIAAAANVGLITAYTRGVLKHYLQTVIIFSVLIILYGYLYVVLQLQDFALLMGSIGLFVILAVVMYLTRKIDWFMILKGEKAEDSTS